MSREAYQFPTANGAGGASRNTFDSSALQPQQESMAAINYICGDCGFKHPLRRTDAIRCKECGCRILYKERTKSEMTKQNETFSYHFSGLIRWFSLRRRAGTLEPVNPKKGWEPSIDSTPQPILLGDPKL
ncbi:hypothetical protein F4778DRAFT_780772 [Xylariomycetidae sp. FL2044]|nr:hypothetical protein F4778DRAFT_780772 [Xylariomycetidae sp. FL2044]